MLKPDQAGTVLGLIASYCEEDQRVEISLGFALGIAIQNNWPKEKILEWLETTYEEAAPLVREQIGKVEKVVSEINKEFIEDK